MAPHPLKLHWPGARPSEWGGRAPLRAALGLFLIAASIASGCEARGPRVSPVRVEATHFHVAKADGSIATREELVGAIVLARAGDGAQQQYRIDAVEASVPGDDDSPWLYSFSVPHPETGRWENPCPPGPDGRRAGFPYPGYWRGGDLVASEDEFSITCTAGTVGKCILMGYVPWERHDASGEPLRDYHQSCVRMLRADYCGDGVSHTRDGTLVELFDALEIQRDTADPRVLFEAQWNEDGAVCIERVRVPENDAMRYIERHCPERLASNQPGDRCSQQLAPPDVKLINRS